MRKFVITRLCCYCVPLYCCASSFYITQQSHTVLTTWFRSDRQTSLYPENYFEVVNCVVCESTRNRITPLFTVSHVWLKLYGVSTIDSLFFSSGLCIEFTVSLVWLRRFGTHSLNLFVASRNYGIPILVETTDGPH